MLDTLSSLKLDTGVWLQILNMLNHVGQLESAMPNNVESGDLHSQRARTVANIGEVGDFMSHSPCRTIHDLQRFGRLSIEHRSARADRICRIR